MPKETVQTNVHGRRFGLSKVNNLVSNDANTLQADAVLVPMHHVMIELTVAEMRAGNTTAVELVAAPGAGFALLVSEVRVSKAAGTAFATIDAAADITIVYNGGSDPVVTDIETAGFLDSTDDELRITRGIDPALGFDITDLADTAIDFELLDSDITLGSVVVFDIYYERIDLTALVA